MRRFLATSAMAGCLAFATVPAHAGLFGAGHTATVTFQAIDNANVLQAEDNVIETTRSNTTTWDLSLPATTLSGTGASSQVKVDMTDTTITLTNILTPTLPFCFGITCPDNFDGFLFNFGGGVDLTGVTIAIDAASDDDFESIATILNKTATGFTVDFTDADPATGSKLILNLTFGPTDPGGGGDNTVPEPGTLALLGFGLTALAAARRRRR